MEPENIANSVDLVVTINKYKLKEHSNVIFDLNKGDKVRFNVTMRDINHMHMHLVDLETIEGYKEIPDDLHDHSRYSIFNEDGEKNGPKTRLFANEKY